MTTLTSSPRLIKGGLVLLDPASSAALRTIVLQYNPDTLTRTLEVQGTGQGGGDRAEALRLVAPPVETIKLEAEIDAADQLEKPDENRRAVDFGLHPQLAALETTLYPPSDRLVANNELAKAGVLEIAPVLAPLTVFIWGGLRIQPVRIIELSITEEAFDPKLNPIRARVRLGMRVLTVHDLGFDVKGGDLYLTYQRAKEFLARPVSPAAPIAAPRVIP